MRGCFVCGDVLYTGMFCMRGCFVFRPRDVKYIREEVFFICKYVLYAGTFHTRYLRGIVFSLVDFNVNT